MKERNSVGLFDILKQRKPSDSELIEGYAQAYGQLMNNADEGRKMADSLAAKAREEGRREGTDHLPIDYGDQLLARAATDPALAVQLKMKREDGVTDDDIRWWWSLPDLERRMMLADDEFHKFHLFCDRRERGLGPEEAGVEIRRYHPLYDVAAGENAPDGEDRPLPVELKRKINDWRVRVISQMPVVMKQILEKSSSFNALVRSEIRAGRLLG